MRYLILFFTNCISYCSICAQIINPDFGQSGKTLINFFERTNDDYNAVALAIDNNNNLVLGGDIYFEGAIQKIKPDGNDDISFANKGFSFFDIGFRGNNRIEETLIDPNGRILAIGHATPNASLANRHNITSVPIVLRFLPDGTPDPNFGQRGKAIFLASYLSFWAFTGIIQTDGKIVIACRASIDPTATDVWNRVGVIRFTSDGRVDSTFGENGLTIVQQFFDWDLFYAGDMGLALQSDGKILLADIRSEGTSLASPAVYRFNPNGKPDSSFAINGMFADKFGYENLALNSILVQPDGNIVVAGNTKTANTSTWLMFRLNNLGKIDSSFANNGKFIYTKTGWLEQTIGHISMQGNDRIIAAACHNTSLTGFLDIFRIKLNGTFDSSFAQNSVIFQHPIQPGGFFFNGAKLSMDASGGIAAMGYGTHFPYRNSSNKGHLIARLSKDGMPLQSFGNGGIKIYYNAQNINSTNNYNYGSSDRLSGIARLSSGKIIVAGTSFRNQEHHLEIMKQ